MERGCPPDKSHTHTLSFCDCAHGFVPPAWQVEAAAAALLERQMGKDSWPRPNDFATKVYREDVRVVLLAAAKAEREERDE